MRRLRVGCVDDKIVRHSDDNGGWERHESGVRVTYLLLASSSESMKLVVSMSLLMMEDVASKP